MLDSAWWFHAPDICYSLDFSTTELGTKLVRRSLGERMSICIALGTILSRSIRDIKKRRETKQQQKREQQQLSEQSPYGSARFQPSMQSGREYQHLGSHEHSAEEVLRDSDHGHPHHHDEPNNSLAHMTVVSSPLQTFDWLDTEVVDPLEDTPPMYDHNAARLPPYGHPRRGRRQREGGRGCRAHEVRNGSQINEPRTRACTGMSIRDPGLDVGQGGAVIWYDALEDRYEVISRSLAPPTEPPLPPPYMPNSCVENLVGANL